MFPFFVGTHDELIKEPDGAYSQLIRLQEGQKEGEGSRNSEADKASNSFNLDRVSNLRSLSRGSSGSRHSHSNSFAHFPFQSSVNQCEERADGDIESSERIHEKPRKVSIKRLAYLNKPEVPVLLLGSIAAAVHGVVFPIFGLLLSSAINMFFEPAHQLRKDSRFWSLLYVGLGLVTLVAIPVQNYFFGIAGGKLIERIRSLTFQKVVHQQISWFDDPANSRYAYKIFYFHEGKMK